MNTGPGSFISIAASLRTGVLRVALAAVPLMLIAALAYFGYGFYTRFVGTPLPAKAGQDIAVSATPAPQVAAADSEFIVLPKPVKTYAPKAKRTLKLPEPVATDDTKRVLDAARIAPSDRPQTVTAVLDTDTGTTTTYVVQEPLPWLDTTVRSDAGVYLGMKRGEPTIRALARVQLAQVKALRLGALASADVPLNGGGNGNGNGAHIDGFVGVGAWMQW